MISLRNAGKKTDLQLALHGHLTAHHRLMLQAIGQSIKGMEDTIRHCLEGLSEELELLETIPGVDRETAGHVLAEITPDMSPFPDHRHLASWAEIASDPMKV